MQTSTDNLPAEAVETRRKIVKWMLIYAVVLMAGCSGNSVQAGYKAVANRAILGRGGIHPTVAAWYYELHPKAFSCEDDPHFMDGSGKADLYNCASCPVGAPDRIIEIPNKSKAYDVPTSINAYFACDDINRLIPEPGSYVDDDVFICNRMPADGFIILDGYKIPCAGGKAEKVKP